MIRKRLNTFLTIITLKVIKEMVVLFAKYMVVLGDLSDIIILQLYIWSSITHIYFTYLVFFFFFTISTDLFLLPAIKCIVICLYISKSFFKFSDSRHILIFQRFRDLRCFFFFFFFRITSISNKIFIITDDFIYIFH